MKKTYIQPALACIEVQTGQLLNASQLPVGQGERNGGEDGNQLAPGYRGELWGDDNDDDDGMW